MTITDPCPNCGNPLAPDQRYCLECGERRGAPRIAYDQLLAPTSETVAAVHSPGGEVPSPTPPERGGWTLGAALASLACVLLAVAIGVLIGRSGDDTKQAATPAPQVIRVEGSPAAATTTAPTATTAEDTSGKASDTSSKTKDSASEKKAKEPSAAETAADEQAVQSLEKASPEEYQKQSQKLPKEVGTSGKAPPKDNKAPAGGGGFEEIG